MNLFMALVFHDSMDEMELCMSRMMEASRQNPSIISWIEGIVTNHEAVAIGDTKCCRVYPCIGHIVHVADPTAESQLTMESYPYMSETRWEQILHKSVGEDPRMFQGVYFLWNRNQARHATEYAKLDFR